MAAFSRWVMVMASPATTPPTWSQLNRAARAIDVGGAALVMHQQRRQASV
ncbi:MAG: hypothetical protein ACH34U_07235 [Cyanobium sp.]